MVLRGLPILGFVVSALAAAPLWSAPPEAETLVLNNGQTLQGRMLRADRNTVMVHLARGGIRALRAVDIQAVYFPPPEPGGAPILGSFIGWQDGAYELSVNYQRVKVQDGVIIETIAPAAPPPAVQPPAPPAPVQAAAPEPTQVAPSANGTEPPAPSVAAVAPPPPPVELTPTPAASPPPARQEPAVAALTPPTPAPDVEPSPAGGLIEIAAAAAPVKPGDPAVVFRFKLSRPADKPLVVIYSTIDGTARAGQDYEAQRGILSIKAGQQAAELAAPILGGAAGGAKSFSLFISTDPKSARTLQRRVEAVIGGNG